MKTLKEEYLKGLAIFRNEDHRKALYASLIFIMLMILFFLLVSLEQPNPPLKDEPVEIVMEDFELEQGSQAAGGNNSQSEQGTPSPSETVQDAPRPTHTQTTTTTPTPSGSGTSNNSNSQAEPRVDSDFTFGGGSGSGNGNGTSFGNGDGVGGNGTGNTPGDGAYNPSRKVEKGASYKAEAQEEGVVALDIWVDASGKVIKTRFNQSKSTSGSQYLIGLAVKAAKTMKYQDKPGAASEFVGYVEFGFRKG